MNRLFILCAAALLFLSACSGEQKTAVIFDTDIGNDIDDAEALDLLYKYSDEGRINLLGVCLNKKGEATAEYLDLMSSWYGYPDVPVGIVRNVDNTGSDADSCYTAKVCALTKEDGTSLFHRAGWDYDNLPDAHLLYRKLLASQPDNSVTIVSVGFFTNLSRLLQTGPDEYSPLSGKELVAKKVKLLSIMAGRFRDDVPEYNVMVDIPSAKQIFTEWPGRIVASPFEIGEAVRYPASCVENDFEWTAHPLKESYVRYQKMPYDNWMFDPTAVVYAVEGASYFTETEKGTILVDDKGVTTFIPSEDGMHSYLKVDQTQASALVEYFKTYLSRHPLGK